MKLTFFIQDFQGGGAQHMFINMANEFAKRGHQVDLLVVNEDGPNKARVSKSVNIVNMGKPRSLSALFPMSRYYKEAKPDILLSAMTHSNVIAILARMLSFTRKTKLIVTERTFLSVHIQETASMRDKSFSLATKLFYRFADKVIGISQGVAEDIGALAHLKDDKVGYIYNPVVTEQLRKDFEDDLEVSLKDNPQQKLIITSGRLSFEKDQETLLHAFAIVRKTQDVKLVLLGNGPLEEELKTTASELNISEHVHFAGFVQNSLAYMKQADLFVMTSLLEGFCNTIVEALYCGLSVVSTDCPSGPREILDNGTFGHLTPVGDAAAFASATISALEHPFNAQKQQERALCFTVDAICDEYLKLFETLVPEDQLRCAA